MDHLKMHTPNKADENFRKLAELFPNAVTETKNDQGEVVRAIDKDVLMQEINTKVVEGREERYQFTWPDKRKSVLLANAPIAKTLRPCREESVNFDTTENLYIEGDNLEVLKLLQETYLGKIKMIYIDPPYNTGNDFVYEDDYSMDNAQFIMQNGGYDEQGNRLFKNMDTNGRFHTDWLNMMYPRLKLARDLLTEDGVIFISIDDNEQENLKKICDEIFGQSNYVSLLPRVTKKGGKSTDYIAKNHDYCLIYSKSQNYVLYSVTHNDPGFCNQDEYVTERGMYKLNQTLDYDTLGYIYSLDYPIKINETMYYAGGVSEDEYKRRKNNKPQNGYRWRWSKELFDFGFRNGFIEVKQGRNGPRIYTKTYQNAMISKKGDGYFVEIRERTKAVSTLEFVDNKYSNDNAKKGIDEILGKGFFDYTKPVSLLQFLIMIGIGSNDIILDFFSGSATTAHAVMQLNAEDGGNRKFIMVQLPEKTDEKSEAYKAGYTNICEIGKERIRRAGAQIIHNSQCIMHNEKCLMTKCPNYESCIMNSPLDVGFRVLKCDSSNMKDVYYSPESYNGTFLNSLTENIKEDRTPEDLLFQVMLDFGILLSSKITETLIGGKKVFDVADGFLIACFDDTVTDEVVTEIAKKKPQYFVMRDSSLAKDSVATNFDQIFALYSPYTTRKVL